LISVQGFIRKKKEKKTQRLCDFGCRGFGRVYAARLYSSKAKKVAIKKMPNVTPKEKKTNMKEVYLLNGLKHPNIVVYDKSFKTKDELWIVMEFMEGGTLKEATGSYHFQESHLAYIAREVLKGLSYLHKNTLVHRDLKPGNIMLTIEGNIKISLRSLELSLLLFFSSSLDLLLSISFSSSLLLFFSFSLLLFFSSSLLLFFSRSSSLDLLLLISSSLDLLLLISSRSEKTMNVSKVWKSNADHRQTVDFGLCEFEYKSKQKPRLVGSPYWIAPEVIAKRPYSYGVDIWSLGVCLVEIANRRVPDKSSSIRV